MSKPEAKKDSVSNELILEYNSMLRVVMAILAILGLMLLIEIILYAPRPETTGENWMYMSALALVAASSLGVLYIAIFCNLVTYKISEGGIKKCNPIFGERFIRWDEVDVIYVSQLHSAFVISSATEQIRLTLGLNGLRDFAKAAKDYLPIDKRKKAEDYLNGLID